MPTIPKVKKPRAKKVAKAVNAIPLREYLAGQALCGLLACPNTRGRYDVFSGDAVRIADATIAALAESK